jgi:tetratricopeptide (TPR) repeat protein
MPKVFISFAEKNVRLGRGDWLFKRQWPQRFEWIALLAFRRLTKPPDQAWVELEEIGRLPSWGGKSRHDTSTYVGRYLQAPEVRRSRIVEAGAKWSGPYRLNADQLSIEFDVAVWEVPNRLQLRPQPSSGARRAALLRFAYSFARAQRLFFRGRIARKGSADRTVSAYDLLMRMTEDRSFTPTLQLLALLAAIDALFRLGRFQVARKMLTENRRRLRHIPDSALRARFYVKLAWAHQRGSSGKRSDHATEAALHKADFHAQKSGDRATLGMLARRIGGYRTKKGFHEEAIHFMTLAVEADLITANYDSLQANCGNIGSIVHRLGPSHYDEARQWLLSSIAIARMMSVGRDDAHAEAILAKIYIEQDKAFRSRWLLERVERIASRAGNRVNWGDTKMIWGFWHERFGKKTDQIAALADAYNVFRSIPEFDARQKARYMERSFPKVWDEVVESSARRPIPSPGTIVLTPMKNPILK